MQKVIGYKTIYCSFNKEMGKPGLIIMSLNNNCFLANGL